MRKPSKNNNLMVHFFSSQQVHSCSQRVHRDGMSYVALGHKDYVE
jgi:hypothetical protein